MKVTFLLLALGIGVALGVFLKPSPAPEMRSFSNSGPLQEVSLQGLSGVTGDHFLFSQVVAETCGVAILPVGKEHQPVIEAINAAGLKVANLMSEADSPAREKRRINEVSALFEDALRLELDAHPDFTCDFPQTQSGEAQRSGYPDLRVEHLPTGTVAYLDPKLFEDKSIKSSFRTFYYEPSAENGKVTEDALHLLIGFPHDGETRAWTFAKPHLVDLAELTVKLKTEFSASNKEVYLAE